jgi:predicted tellurium resistance membrane protein TerC
MDKNVQFEIENYFIFFENNANVILSLFRATCLSILSFVGFELFIHLLSKSVISKRVVSLNAIFSNKGSIFYDLRMEKENRNTGYRRY